MEVTNSKALQLVASQHVKSKLFKIVKKDFQGSNLIRLKQKFFFPTLPPFWTNFSGIMESSTA